MIWFDPFVTLLPKYERRYYLRSLLHLKEYSKQVILTEIIFVDLHIFFVGYPKANQAHLPQKAPSVFDSSLLSPQSLRKLHIIPLSIHFPLLHWNFRFFSHVPGFPRGDANELNRRHSNKSRLQGMATSVLMIFDI